jgi:ParB family transcriptional regulator, chromosome partitioning protein
MTIEHLATASLIPYARNAKKHDASQVAKLAGSIREFGFNNPVLIDNDNGIIAGHGRVMAAQSLGLETVPCIRLGHLSDTQRRAYILADNRLAEIGGGWDEEMLKLELADLAAAELDVTELGFLDSDAGMFDVSETNLPELESGDRQPFQQKTFTLHDEQAEEIDAAISKAKEMGHAQSAVNENSNGNALAFICQSFNRVNA